MTELFQDLERISARPKPFEIYSAKELWTDEHTSSQMLGFHLNEEVDLSSRNLAFINRSVEWITSHFNLGAGTKVIDFGCGPGLYTTRLAEHGSEVTGIDFSRRSIEYAEEEAAKRGLEIRYLEQNYLEGEIDGKFDLILMVMCDFCVLNPEQRHQLLQRFKKILTPDGRVLLDVYSLVAFEKREESSLFQRNLLNGFFSAEPYFGFLHSFKYEKEKVSLDKYTSVEPSTTREIFNWLQYFTVDALARELSESGLSIDAMCSDVAGSEFSEETDEFAIVAKLHD